MHSHSHMDGTEHDHAHHDHVETASRTLMDVLAHEEGHDEPFYLDEQGREDRDSCLAYTLNLLQMYTTARDRIIMDSDHYEAMSSRLEESYDYARNRYRLIRKRIFIDGQDNYFKVIGSLPRYVRMATQDTRRKYGIGDNNEIIYPTLRRPYNLYAAYWIDGLSEAEKENTWIQRLNYDPETEEKYNRQELERLGAYKNYKWLQEPMIWAHDYGVVSSLTQE